MGLFTGLRRSRPAAAATRRRARDPGAVACACGRFFASDSARRVHLDGRRCMAQNVWDGLLVQRADGVWTLRR